MLRSLSPLKPLPASTIQWNPIQAHKTLVVFQSHWQIHEEPLKFPLANNVQ
ncbi:hypothetical protein D1872_206420 [compost metagenome]